MPCLSVEGHMEEDSVEDGVRSPEREASPSRDKEYKDDDEQAQLARVRAEHPLLSIPALRLVATAAMVGASSEPASSSAL
jgi:hypothetical protein